MALLTTLKWILQLGENVHQIEEQLLDFISPENHENDESSRLSIPQILQEVYYVDQLSKNLNDELLGRLSIQDKIYDYIRVFHGRITELLELHHKDLINETQSEEIIERLENIYGAKVGTYVQENLPEPFLTRDVAYMIFNTLPSNYKYQLPHYARRDIVAKYDCFEKYWNKGMFLLCEMQNDVHMLDFDGLNILLSELSHKNHEFCERYLSEKGGCFCLTEVNKNGTQQHVLCFSGQKFTDAIIAAINCIVNSGHFNNPFTITKSDKVRYYICPHKYVTYADACKTNKASKPRMFSCCERKTFAEYNWQDVDSYVMIVKYQPCELCQLPVFEHTMKYRGRIIAGIRLAPLRGIPLFDAIAEEIYNEVHASKLHEQQ